MDLEEIKSLIALMVENDLSRIEIQEGERRILLKRGGEATVVTSLPAAAGAAGAPPAAATHGAAARAGGAGSGESNDHLIRSPMVGTFYAAADPESPPFVKVGDPVGPDTVVCLIEAMKVFNEIKAEVSGRVTKVLASNAQAVEYDQPLFAVAPH